MFRLLSSKQDSASAPVEGVIRPNSASDSLRRQDQYFRDMVLVLTVCIREDDALRRVLALPNRSCNAVILVQAKSRGEGANPRCTCGSAMKKASGPPFFVIWTFFEKKLLPWPNIRLTSIHLTKRKKNRSCFSLASVRACRRASSLRFSTTRCRIRRPQTREAGPGWGRGVLAAEVLSGVRCAKRGESQAGISLRESGGGAVRVRR